MNLKYLAIGGALLLFLGLLYFGLRAGTGNSVGETLTPVEGFRHAHGMAADILDKDRLYIATHEGLYLLQEEKDLYRVGKNQDDLMGFSAHPKEAGVFFSSGHPAYGGNIGLQKTMDGGMTWRKVSNGLGGPADFHAMAIGWTDPERVYGFYGGRLQRSSDGGASWEYALGKVSPISLTTDPKEADTLYAATESGLKVSQDGGDSWRSLSSELEGGVVTVFALNPHNSKSALAFSTKLGGLGVSSDGGVTWKKVEENFSGTILYLAFSPAVSEKVYALTDRNSLYRSLDGGSTWEKLR